MEPLNIVAVCTGNICRSPLSEYLLKNSLNPEHFSVSSAGTRAVRDGTVPERQIKIANKLGLDSIAEHKPHQITVNDIQNADLLLTATLRHRRRIVRTLPSASSRVFTMREYAHLAPHVEDASLIELFAQEIPELTVAALAVHQLRGTVPPPSEDDAYDIVDPFGEDKKTYRISAEQLVAAHEPIVEFLQRIERLAVKLETSHGMRIHTSAGKGEMPFPPVSLRSQEVAPPDAPVPHPLSRARLAPSSQTTDAVPAPLAVHTPAAPHSTAHLATRPAASQSTFSAAPQPGRADGTTGSLPKVSTNTFEFPPFPVDGPPTLGKGIQLGLDASAPSQRSGKHTFNPKNPDHAKSRHQIMSTSRNVPAPKADRGKHRRYSK